VSFKFLFVFVVCGFCSNFYWGFVFVLFLVSRVRIRFWCEFQIFVHVCGLGSVVCDWTVVVVLFLFIFTCRFIA